MIHLTIAAANATELQSQLSGLLSAVAGGSVPAATEKKAPVEKKEPAAKAPATPAAPATPPAAPAAPVAQAAPAASTAEVEVRGTYIAKIAKVKGKPAAIELLAKFGAKRNQEVKASDHAAFVAEAKTLLGE